MSMVDKAKLWTAALLAIGAIYASFHFLETRQTAVRSLTLIGGLAMAALIAYFSQPGKDFIGYAKASAAEMRKMVWPSKNETMQMTAIVIAFVIAIGLFLWAVDAVLLWLFQYAAFGG